MQLIIIRGEPGSGKSSYVHKHFPDLFHIEQDKACMVDGKYMWSQNEMTRRVFLCLYLTEAILKDGCDCVVSNTFTQRKELKKYLKLAETYGATVKIIALKTHFGNIHNVPEETLLKMKTRWQDIEGETVITDQKDL